MRSKTRLSSYCTKRANNGVNLVTSRDINTRLARPIVEPKAHNARGDFHIQQLLPTGVVSDYTLLF